MKKYFTDAVVKRGKTYHKLKLVEDFFINEYVFTATVLGGTKYIVEIVFDENLEPAEMYCSCPYFDTANCKHLAAFLYYLNEKGYFDENKKLPELRKIADKASVFFPVSVTNINSSLSKEETEKKQIEAETSALRSTFSSFINSGNSRNGSQTVTYKMGYAIELSGYGSTIRPVRQRLRSDGSVASVEVASKINFDKIQPVEFEEKILLDYLTANSFDRFFAGFETTLSESIRKKHLFNDILNFLPGKDVYSSSYYNFERIEVIKNPADAFLNIDKDEKDEILIAKLSIELNGNSITFEKAPKVILDEPLWVFFDKSIFRINNLNVNQFNTFFENNFRVEIPKRLVEVFENDFLPEIASRLPIQSTKYEIIEMHEVPGKKILLKEFNSTLHLKVVFDYSGNDLSYDPLESFTSVFNDGKIITIYRDKDYEDAAYNIIRELHVKSVDKGVFIPRQNPIEFLLNNFDYIKESGFEILGQDNLGIFKVNTAAPKVSFNVSSGIDWFDLETEVNFNGVGVAFSDLAAAIKNKKNYVKLSDGSTGVLPEKWIQKIKYSLSIGEVHNSKVRFTNVQTLALDSIIEEADDYETDEKFKERVSKLKSFEKVKRVAIPRKLNGKLRGYQKEGFNWFFFLKEYSFGGILADDMGLGKTVQAIALLLREKSKRKNYTSLIVAPTSVVFNWIDEINKFAPSLSVLNHTGTQRIKEDESHLAKYDVIITSYGIVLRDYDLLSNLNFHYIILDESQKIKNPNSKTGKIIRKLNADNKLCLTGTPIENNLSELWSQMSFLNPGLLGSFNKFNKSFVKSIQKNGDKSSLEFLRKTIYPFILRRTKDLVAKELPPKSELIHYCEMEEDQAKVYNFWKESIRFEILQEIDKKGIKKSGFKVLEGLLRLRQICNHPALVENKYKKKSGKFEELKIMLEKVIEEDHKAIVFSQFVQMLEIMKGYLDKKKIKYEYLTGATKNREERIKNFKDSDETKLFLISLKAGGFGINLTEADYVLHYDPWWNPAVEDQATDRAHRIGQDKHVFVYKFITKDSIEEKILHLQNKKRKLVEDIILADSGLLKNLTREDISILFE
ncbi:MAG: DEAD/DEAH box helicase family protein [Melioribacteraceae bacterium]|nr:DEAD/DEAH box helicase family protein [Melioribacteraceae bacterium]MCF8356820.1 DEAD/DEAH box helicase family protein [Melioribacteraceae bacterium]MCF8396189.1 DEAD/DEAH box helicase family protein [Melioribacteraceae bacterium]